MGFLLKTLSHSMTGAFGGGIRRQLSGTAIGTAYGAAASDKNSATGIFEDAMLGGMAGLGIGSLTTKTMFNIGKEHVYKPLLGAGSWKNAIAGLNALQYARKEIQAGINVGRWVAKNPYKTMMVAGMGYASYDSGYGQNDASVEELEMYLQMAGVPSTGFDPGMGASMRQESHNMFVQSTNGLVQGLHAGRRR